MKQRLHLVVCRHYGLETREVLRRPGFEGVTFDLFDGLCDRFPVTWADLEPVLSRSPEGAAVRVVGGSCLIGLNSPPGHRPPAEVLRFDHCFSLVAPAAYIDSLFARREFLTTPCWLLDWRRVLNAWGLDRETARAMFHESSNRIQLLDTGVLEDAGAHLEEMGAFLDLPWMRTEVGLEHFELQLRGVVASWKLETAGSELTMAHQRIADLEAAVDAVRLLGEKTTEVEVIERLQDLATRLFGASRVCYLPVMDGKPSDPLRANPDCSEAERLRDPLHVLLKGPAPTLELPSGFMLRIDHETERLGVLVVEGLAFPEYHRRYLMLADSMAGAFGLAIAHARLIDRLEVEKEEIERRLQLPAGAGELPVMCAGCERVREGDQWLPVDEYLLIHQGLAFSHGLCPGCSRKYYRTSRQDPEMGEA